MKDELIYQERLTSNKTLALFVGLTILFLVLLTWRVMANGLNGLAILFLVFLVFFLFYSVNYRTLIIHITPDFLKLKFGIFTWTVVMDNIETCTLDHLPTIMRLGGAGIHFMFIRGRYRASFNFLEYPRLAIAFKRKAGPVRDLSFSTRQPDEILSIINKAITDQKAPK